MNKELICSRFNKAMKHGYEQHAVVQQHIARKMIDLLKGHIPSSDLYRALEIGCGSGYFTRLFTATYRCQRLWLNDLCPDVKESLVDILSEHRVFCEGDIETYDIPKNLDLIVSCSAVQWLNNATRFIVQCSDKLSKNGMIAISTFGPDNLLEISHLIGIGLHYPSLETWSRCLSTHYQIEHLSQEHITMYFDHPRDVLIHLKETGVTGVGQRKWTPKTLQSFYDEYQRSFSSDQQQVSLTYHPIYIIIKHK